MIVEESGVSCPDHDQMSYSSTTGTATCTWNCVTFDGMPNRKVKITFNRTKKERDDYFGKIGE